MTARRFEYVLFNGRYTHVSAWGNSNNPAIIMWHGLARTGRDFDEAAEYFSKDYFVICPDTIGRGLSSWAKDPASEYNLENYGAQALSLLEHYNIDQMGWLGTSMGALIGMHLAGSVLAGRITHLVLNDIGPEIPAPALERIIKYVGEPPKFHAVPEFENWLREVYKPFGPNSEEYWRRMTDTSARRLSNGMVTAHYDPKVVWQFTDNQHELPMWEAYDNIRAKTWLTRGVSSDILPLSVTKEMRERGPKPEFYEFNDCGHAPTFTTPDANKLLEAFWGS